ncbi:alpha/beta hydrolase [Pseudonocardia sp. DSM 110487]|uniref:alpha/beta hydrolase n=1 Tax=Pseudonocardia sp. DSM 110487 TaxID=2865833 RepID=UPI001C69CD6A|nr:alpha/beta hydrolase fold domain-containing protein [Pseudonocardia sp. DSM 110487]QYN39605.1 alpha/beta hydrolase [Pseudonocardia sp. DSM 110487]
MDAGRGLTTASRQRPAFDIRALARRIADLGAEVSQQVLVASHTMYAPFHERAPYVGIQVDRDIAYGSHPRQRLDLFRSVNSGSGRPRPVVVFVHGGGFVGGDKNRPGSPYHDNVAVWAVRRNLVGITMTYRLAPEFGWPAGPEDVAAALGWVRTNIDALGGDPGRVHLMGTSAGAVHAASYLAGPEFQHPGGPGVASASLLSGAYDLPSFDHDRLRPYYGDDPGRYADLSPLRGLLDCPVPVLYVVAEFDPPAAQRQAAALVDAYTRRHGRWPAVLRLAGHNHFTSTAHLNTPDDELGRQVLAEIARQPATARARRDH